MRLRLAVPSSITLGGALAALLAILWAPARPLWAANAIIAAALCDMIDGRVARMLDAQTELGAQLDSLVDVIAFGVAPGLLAYHARLEGLGTVAHVPIGLAPLFAFVAASALRLARFNSQPDSGTDFEGIPTPVAALLVTTPIMSAAELGWSLPHQPALYAVLMVVVAALMVSPVRFPSFKHIGSRVLALLYYATMAAGVTMLFLGLPGGTVLFAFLVIYLGRGLGAALVRRARPAQDERSSK